MKRISLFSVLAALFLSTGIGLGQTTSGDLVGTIKDVTGAVVPNATVSVTSETTGVVTKIATNGSGEYRVQNLLPSTYDVAVQVSGFQESILKGVRVDLNKTSTANLEISAGTTTSVVVESNAGELLDTTSQNLVKTFSNVELSVLPTATLGTLGVLNASLLSPGVASSGGIGIGTGPSIGGQRPRNNNFTIEGIDNNNKSVTGPLVFVPNDAVGEFTLITNQFSPEFGHSSGGQFNTNVLSGTNQFHGRLYEYFENRNLNAENAPAGQKVPNPRFDYNRYGGQFGGPIKRDKIFFFANYERHTTGQNLSSFLCTPTAAGLSTLSSLVTPYGLNANNVTQYEKYMPAANYYGGAQVSSTNDLACNNEATGPQSMAVFSGTSLAAGSPYVGLNNGRVYGSGSQTNIPLGNYHLSAATFANFDALTTSGDYTISNSDSLRARYIYNKNATQDTAASLPAFYVALPLKYHLIALSEFHTFTQNLVNEARVGFNRYQSSYPVGPQSFPGLDSFPNLTFYDQDGLNLGPDPNAPQSTIQNLYQFTDNISYTKGNHTIKIGFDGRKYISPQTFTQRVRGDYEWDYTTEYLHDLAPTDFGQRSTGNFIYYGDQTALYGYANDTWRATPKLTINYGLRYEFTSVPVGERAQSLNLAASVPGLITFSAPQPAYKNFAPRVGFNYSPDGKTSIRAGFGLAYDVLFDNLGLLSFPPQYSSTNSVGGVGEPSTGSPNFLQNGGLPAGTGTLATFGSIAAQRAATSAYLPNQITPYAESYNLQIQRTLFQNYTVSVGYLGTRGIHLPTQVQLNVQARVTEGNQLFTDLLASDATSGATVRSSTANANTLANINALSNILPQYLAAGLTNKITSYQPYSQSNYNGLLLNLQHSFHQGFQLNASYTWSKTMDDATAEVFSTVLTPRRPQDSQNVAADYSRSALDRTNRVTLEAVYDVPFFKQSSYLLKNVVGNWTVAPVYTYESPEYTTALSGVNSNLNGDSSTIDRPLANPGGSKTQGDAVNPVYSSTLANLCAAGSAVVPNTTTPACSANLIGYTLSTVHPNAYYIQAGAGTLPNVARNTLPIRPINNFDLTASKRINFTQRCSFEFQAQAFNVFNHAQFIPGSIDTVATTATNTLSTQFQTVSNSKFGNAPAEFKANARTLQLSAKMSF